MLRIKFKEKIKKLHIGCGNIYLNEWINSDLLFLKNIDLVFDATLSLPFFDNSVNYIFAEHFLEHLTEKEGLSFIKETYRILKKKGIIRISTPNLDWVWATHYQLYVNENKKRENAKMLNRAFYGWGHKNLYNDITIQNLLKRKRI